MQTTNTKPAKILPLTSLRFFAALYFVFYHTIDQAFGTYRDLSTVHGRVVDLGYVAVSFFFTLSGYILSVSYLARQVSKGKFWRARFAHVYPLFLFTLLIDVPQYLAGLTKQLGFHAALRLSIERILEIMLLLQAWIPSLRGIDWPNWSLSVEALFYLVFPLLILVIARLSVRQMIAVGTLSYIAGMIAVTAAVHSRVSYRCSCV